MAAPTEPVTISARTAALRTGRRHQRAQLSVPSAPGRQPADDPPEPDEAVSHGGGCHPVTTGRARSGRGCRGWLRDTLAGRAPMVDEIARRARLTTGPSPGWSAADGGAGRDGVESIAALTTIQRLLRS